MKEQIRNTEEKFKDHLAGQMTKFKSETTFNCPWLRFWIGSNANVEKVEGIIMLQDWGLYEDELLETHVNGIRNSFSGTLKNESVKKREDLTIKNLRGNDFLRQKIFNGEIVVMNAVWGCRVNDKKCGYLGDPIHKKAFEIWSEIVEQFAKRDKFYVMFAGEWAQFNEMSDTDRNLKTYLKRWADWTKKKTEDFKDVKGRSLFCSHPCMWKMKKTCSKSIFFTDPGESDWRLERIL